MGRSLAALLALLAALAVAGCGGGEEEGGPLDSALGYLPEDAALAVVISTDFEGDDYAGVRELLERFPPASQAVDGLRGQIEEGGEVSYERDVEPLLGNPLVIGVPTAQALQADEVDDLLMAIETGDAGKAEQLARRDARPIGEIEGAKAFEDSDGDGFTAVDDSTLVFANTRERLAEALRRRDGDERLREEHLDGALEGLPENAPFKVYTDLEALLEADRGTAAARRVEWVGALSTFGAALSVGRDALTFDMTLDTSDGDLSDDDLPIAAGDESPGVAERPGEVGVGVRGLAQVVRFAERAGQAANPAGYAGYVQLKRRFGQQIDIDVDRDLIGQLSGETAVSIGLDGSYAVRTRLADPRRMETTLERLANAIPELADGAGLGVVGVARPRGEERFYGVARPGAQGLVFGVVDDVLVVANDPERASRLASEQPRRVSGAQGAVVVHADAERIAADALARFARDSGADVGGLTGPLGDFVGQLAADDDGLRGRLRLGLDDGG